MPAGPPLLDTLQSFETPEGVELGLKLAGPAPRAFAWLIDGVIKMAVTSLSSVFLFFGEFGLGLQLLYLFILLWLYNVLFELFADGATPGKKAMNLRVVNSNGTPVSWFGSIMRNLVRVVDMLPGTYTLGTIAALLNPRFQRLGDMAGGTVVVYQTRGQKPAANATDAAAPLRLPLSLDEQRSILAFSERGSRLTKERAVELAEILEDVTGERGEAAVAKLHAHGNWLAGRS